MSYNDAKLKCIRQLAEKDWGCSDYVRAWYCYCDGNNHSEWAIYDMSEMDNLLNGYTPSQVLRIVSDKINMYDNYFAFDRNGHIVTLNNPFDYKYFNAEAIYQSIADNGIGVYPDLDEDEAIDYLIHQIEMDYKNFSYEEIEDAVYELFFDLFSDDWDELVEEVVARIQPPEE